MNDRGFNVVMLSFRHAGIYTTEEATRITKDKLVRLHALYMDQFHRLGHVLREKRRKYVHALRKEREHYCSIANQPRETPQERDMYAKLKAMNKYHKRHGVEAVLHRKYCERRARSFGGPLVNKPLFHNRCMFAEGGVKCAERAIPCCKFCRKHVLEDKKQVLFRACGVEKSGVVCQESVPMIFDDATTCVLHIEMPPERTYVLKKYESEPEEADDEEEDGDEEKADAGSAIKTEAMSPAPIQQIDDGAVEIKEELMAEVMESTEC